MMDYRKILMLRSMGLSQREMERNKIASRETTKEIFDVADRLGVHWPLEDDVTNNDLERLLFPDKYKNVCMYVEPDYPYIHKELAKNGVTLTLLWEEYRRKCYEAEKNALYEHSVCREIPQVGQGHKGHNAHPAQAWGRH